MTCALLPNQIQYNWEAICWQKQLPSNRICRDRMKHKCVKIMESMMKFLFWRTKRNQATYRIKSRKNLLWTFRGIWVLRWIWVMMLTCEHWDELHSDVDIWMSRWMFALMSTCQILCSNVDVWEYENVLWCQLIMKVQGCMMLNWTYENVICQHVRMWDVNMWECEMLMCGMSTYKNVRWWHVECRHVRCQYVRMWEHALCNFDLKRFSEHVLMLTLRTCIAYDQMSGMQEFENACTLCMTRCQVHMNLWMHMSWVCISGHQHVNTCCIPLDVDLWTCNACVRMSSMNELY